MKIRQSLPNLSFAEKSAIVNAWIFGEKSYENIANKQVVILKLCNVSLNITRNTSVLNRQSEPEDQENLAAVIDLGLNILARKKKVFLMPK